MFETRRPPQPSSRGPSAAARSRLAGSEGLTKMLFDDTTGRAIGCGIVGQSAGDLIAAAAQVIEMGLMVYSKSVVSDDQSASMTKERKRLPHLSLVDFSAIATSPGTVPHITSTADPTGRRPRTPSQQPFCHSRGSLVP